MDQQIWASTKSLTMWHAFGDDDRALCRSSIRPKSAARYTYAETDRPYQVVRNHCERCRKILADRAAEQAAAETKAAQERADRRPDVVIPGALADILSEANLMTGADDHDPASKATRIALEGARAGRGRTLVIKPSSTDVLDVISTYADTVLNCADNHTRAEIDAARTWIERAGHARKHYARPTATPTVEQPVEPAVEEQPADVVRVATRGYRKPGGCAVELRTTVHANCPCRIGATLIGTYATMAEAEKVAADQVRGSGRTYGHCIWSRPLNSPAAAPDAEAVLDRMETDDAAAFVTVTRAVDAVEHAEETGAAVATVEEAEALYAAALVTEADAADGTWQGEWIGEQPTDTLFAVEPPAEQGALFTKDAPAAPLVVRMHIPPAARERMKAKAAAERAEHRAEMDDHQAAEHRAHGVPVPAAVQARIDARTAQAGQAVARRAIEGVIVAHQDTAEGSAPEDADHPDVIAARAALHPLKAAQMTDRHDFSEPTEEERHVRGYVIHPRTQGRVALYWLEGGRQVRHDDPWHGPCLDILADKMRAAGWATERMLKSSICVFAHRPQ